MGINTYYEKVADGVQRESLKKACETWKKVMQGLIVHERELRGQIESATAL